jgi:ATP-dependent RNA circularization protein (DNA/RNA ligase family)
MVDYRYRGWEWLFPWRRLKRIVRELDREEREGVWRMMRERDARLIREFTGE